MQRYFENREALDKQELSFLLSLKDFRLYIQAIFRNSVFTGTNTTRNRPSNIHLI
jgi:hypothetical protein